MAMRLMLTCVMALLLEGSAAAADAAPQLKLPAIFSDGMVLQRDKPVAVWGWDEPGATVTVAFAGQTKTAKAGPDGKWMTQFDPLTASSQPQEFVVSSSAGGAKTVADVLVGEVWLCGGQSNMAMTVDGKTAWLHIGGVLDAKKVVAESANPRIRQFYVNWKVSTTPLDDCTGTWTAAGPETTANFSATGYFFARALEKKLGVPVAIVSTSWGGSTAENWTSREALTTGTDPEFVARMEKILHDYDHHDEIYAKYVTDLAAWETSLGRVDPGGANEDARYAAVDADLAGWKPVTLPTPLAKLGFPHGGVVWLRREIDVPEEYGKQWRLDFLATGASHTLYMDGVRMADGGRPGLPKEVARAGRHVVAVKLHAQEGKAGITGGSFMVVPFDPKLPTIPLLGDWLCTAEKEFEPLAKDALPRPVAPARVALHWQPVPGQFNGMLHPLIPYGLRGFAICGPDHVWHWADATIDGSRVVVISAAVKEPVAVRYAWANHPICNLVNGAGLPAFPFRSDDFSPVLAGDFRK